jgi:hypothetical protein
MRALLMKHRAEMINRNQNLFIKFTDFVSL